MSAENLSQMGAANVQRLVDQYGQQVIDKCPVSPVEYAFYEHAAEELNSGESKRRRCCLPIHIYAGLGWNISLEKCLRMRCRGMTY
jgi:hypothetical protein